MAHHRYIYICMIRLTMIQTDVAPLKIMSRTPLFGEFSRIIPEEGGDNTMYAASNQSVSQ